jgi:hypothetical protein
MEHRGWLTSDVEPLLAFRVVTNERPQRPRRPYARETQDTGACPPP